MQQTQQYRAWAVWRRAQYIGGVFVFFIFVLAGIYLGFFYEGASCFDGTRNGTERAVDCGGACTRICAMDVTPPRVLWAKAFRVTDGQYNAVAYIENTNIGVGSPEVVYTLTLADSDGIIAVKTGTAVLPPDSVYPVFEGRIQTGDRIPTTTTLTIDRADLWLPAPVGREQFVVEGRQLMDADSKPRLIARITNNELTEAQDVEIVATIFDARGNALTSSRTVVEYFSPRTTETVVFTWPEPIAKTVRSCEVPTDVVLALDLSGSMNDDGGDPPQPITSVLRAAEAFVDRLNPADQIGVVRYATEALVSYPLGADKAAARSTIGSLAISSRDEIGSTNTGDAVIKAGEELASMRHNEDARKVMVLLTDGLANAPSREPETYALNTADTLKAEDVEIFTIGLGDSVNATFLESLASDANHYYQVASVATIDRIYRSITEAICEDGAAVIEIIPKTDTNFAS